MKELHEVHKPVNQSPKQMADFLLHTDSINKLLIIDNVFILADRNNDDPPYTWDEVNAILMANYAPGDFNQIPFINSPAAFKEALRNAQKALKDPNAPYYSYTCPTCRKTNVTLSKRQLDLLAKLTRGKYKPTCCKECLQRYVPAPRK